MRATEMTKAEPSITQIGAHISTGYLSEADEVVRVPQERITKPDLKSGNFIDNVHFGGAKDSRMRVFSGEQRGIIITCVCLWWRT